MHSTGDKYAASSNIHVYYTANSTCTGSDRTVGRLSASRTFFGPMLDLVLLGTRCCCPTVELRVGREALGRGEGARGRRRLPSALDTSAWPSESNPSSSASASSTMFSDICEARSCMLTLSVTGELPLIDTSGGAGEDSCRHSADLVTPGCITFTSSSRSIPEAVAVIEGTLGLGPPPLSDSDGSGAPSPSTSRLFFKMMFLV